MLKVFGIFSNNSNYISQNNFKKDEVNNNEYFEYFNFKYGRVVTGKFPNEQIVFENDDLICCFDGFLFDIKNYNKQIEFIKNELNANNYFNFIKDLNGSFSGYIYLKDLNKILVFVDHLATRKIYYSKSNDYFIFSSELYDITNFIRKNITLEIDYNNLYTFLGFGYFLKDQTLFKNIYQLKLGCLLEYDINSNNLKLIEYNKFIIREEKYSYDEILQRYDDYLVSSVKRVININESYNYPTSCSLSGGLDSKTVFSILCENSLNDILTITFADSRSSDAKIASKVAREMKKQNIFISLDNGKYLTKNYKKYTEYSNGMIILSGSLHALDALSKINLSNYGLYLTGQIGNAIFWYFVKDSFNIANYSYAGVPPKFVLDKIENLNNILKEYEKRDLELFALEQKLSNGTIYGDLITRAFTEPISPFYNKELIKFTLSVPKKLKKNEQIYIDYIKKFHPQIAKFNWDKSNCRPINADYVRLLKKIHLVKNGLKKRLGLYYDSMNPFDYWFSKNPEIIKTIDEYFYKNLDFIELDKNFSEDLIDYYKTTNDRYCRNKFNALALINSLNYHYGKFK